MSEPQDQRWIGSALGIALDLASRAAERDSQQSPVAFPDHSAEALCDPDLLGVEEEAASAHGDCGPPFGVGPDRLRGPSTSPP